MVFLLQHTQVYTQIRKIKAIARAKAKKILIITNFASVGTKVISLGGMNKKHKIAIIFEIF